MRRTQRVTPLIANNANKVHELEDGTEGLSEQNVPTHYALLQQLQLHLPVATDTRPDWHLRTQERREILMGRNVVVS